MNVELSNCISHLQIYLPTYPPTYITIMDSGGRLLPLLLFRVVVFAGKMERCSHAYITNVHIGTF